MKSELKILGEDVDTGHHLFVSKFHHNVVSILATLWGNFHPNFTRSRLLLVDLGWHIKVSIMCKSLKVFLCVRLLKGILITQRQGSWGNLTHLFIFTHTAFLDKSCRSSQVGDKCTHGNIYLLPFATMSYIDIHRNTEVINQMPDRI